MAKNEYNITTLPDIKTQTFVSVIANYSIFDRYSNLRMLQRVVAYCLRFSRITAKYKRRGDLSLDELKTSLKLLIKLAWNQILGDKIKILKSKRSIYKGKLKSLDPLIDDDGFLRVGGRLKNANINDSQKSPEILPQHNLQN